MHYYKLKIVTRVSLAVLLWLAHVTVSMVIIFFASGVIHEFFATDGPVAVPFLFGVAIVFVMSAYRTLEEYITAALKSVEEDFAAEEAKEEARVKRLKALREMDDTANLNVER